MPSPTVHVHALDATRIDPGMAGGLLTSDEHAEAARFHHAGDQSRWSRFRAATRIVLARALECEPAGLELRRTATGKPELVDPPVPIHFNLSHSGDFGLLAWSSAGPVGVDVEADERAAGLEACFSSITSTEERASMARESDLPLVLLDLWTAKEAWLKAWGIGFAIDPSDLTIRWLSEHRGAGQLADGLAAPPWPIHLQRLPRHWMPGHRAVLALAGSPPEVIFHPFVPETFRRFSSLCPA